MVTTAELAVDCRNLLGEKCFWDPRSNDLWWTDIHGNAAWRMDAGGRTERFVLPGRGCFILPRESGGFVIGFPSQICLADREFTTFHRIHDVEPHLPQTRINDACVDPYGGIVFGTFDETHDMAKRRPVASVYRLGPDRSLRKLFSDVILSNGLAFAPDGATMYFADSPIGLIRRFRVGPEFSYFEEVAPFAGIDDAPGEPDGSAVDAEGNYWNARVWGGCVVRFNPVGKVDRQIDLPARGPTCVGFGGDNLKTLYITSLRVRHTDDELAATPHAGGVFSAAVSTPGIPQLLCSL